VGQTQNQPSLKPIASALQLVFCMSRKCKP